MISLFTLNQLWYDQTAVQRLVAVPNATRDAYKNAAIIMNPEHKLDEALKLLEELNNNWVDGPTKLEKIRYPIHRNGNRYDFIEIRYMGEGIVSDNEYADWFLNFKECVSWIINHRYLIGEVSKDGSDE